MFDMGFTEMMLIGIVALVIIGPERLPGVARTAGKYFSRLRNFMMNVRADVESELKADELREILKKQQEELSSLKDVVNDVGKDLNLSEDLGVVDIKKSIQDAMPDLNSSLDPDPLPETGAELKKTAKVSPEKKVSSKKKASPKKKVSSKKQAAPKLKAASKLKPGPKKTRVTSKVPPKKAKTVPKAKAAPKKAKAAPPAKLSKKKLARGARSPV